MVIPANNHSGASDPLVVRVDPPLIAGDTVAFSWQQSEENPFQSENSFFLRYEDIDLARFPESLFYEIFFAYQLQIFGHYRRPVAISCSTPVWKPGFQFWRKHHSANQVRLDARGGCGDSPATQLPPPDVTKQCRAAVLYGGGKDSTCIASLLGEVLGNEQTLLINFVEPRRTNSLGTIASIEQRRDALLLAPMRELGFPTQRVWTDFLAIQRPAHRRALLAHYHFYMAGALPVFLNRGIELSTIANERTSYRVTAGSQPGKSSYRYSRSRPEFLAVQSSHFEKLGSQARLTNINYLFTALIAAELLAVRYPDAFSRVLMCMHASARQRWCLQCVKCAEYAFYSLYCGSIDPRFDYDRFFQGSNYVAAILRSVTESGEPLSHGNAAWTPEFSYSDHFESFCHMLAQIDPVMLASRISEAAMANLQRIKFHYGNRLFPESEVLFQTTIDSLAEITDAAILEQIVAIARQYFPIAAGPEEPFWLGNETAEFDFRFVMPTPFDRNVATPRSPAITTTTKAIPAP